MAKEDWYFVIGTVLALVALVLAALSTDWKLVWGRLPVPTDYRHWCVFALILGSLAFSTIGWRYKILAQRPPIQFVAATQETIYGRNYLNEIVEIDNKIFDHCTFTDVRLFYRGVGPWSFKEVKFNGNIMIQTDSMPLKSYNELLNAAEKIKGKRPELFVFDSKGNLSPLSPPVINPPAKPQENK
jgi:hypothetical protein